eukprot:CAMPEP_0197584266 /NCGR_PEP_ID=MMETSP1326-20131121/6942_1 /TAXON_ID=1155430 /ORGANISM="Genus nov. species nov., Strain RCC2288" /LENGTH=326 /DNA_ID=CAMNT_0043148617 /DNA_START=480 /DNA_END=1456 /DNA_ORIENTATION=+
MAATAEAFHGGGGDFNGSDAGSAAAGSGLYKLVKLGNNGSVYAPSDEEVARIEASFMSPDLHDAEKELLTISGNEEDERRALLERMQAYDLMLSRIETHASESNLGAHGHPLDELFTSTTGDNTGAGSSGDKRASHGGFGGVRKSPSQEFLQGGDFALGGFNNHEEDGHGHGRGGEEDVDVDAEEEDEEGDLLCDFGAPVQADGSIGLMDSDGTHVLFLPPAPRPPPPTSSYKMKGGPSEQQRKAMLMGQGRGGVSNGRGSGHGRDTEPCLSDSWHPTDSSDSSITGLRAQYQRVFGRETSSNNRQWLTRRLAEIYQDTDDGLGGG